jgi:hypothetical protein
VSWHTVEPMDRRDVSALAEELAQLTCEHLPWSDQRVIAIELGVGQCDLAIEDMVRGAFHGACPVPSHIAARLYEPIALRLSTCDVLMGLTVAGADECAQGDGSWRHHGRALS